MERIPPHNEEAERSVLGAAMLDKDALYDVLEVLRPKDFYNQNHKEIFEAISELARRNVAVDVLTVSEELKKRNVLEMVGGRGYVATLSGEASDSLRSSSLISTRRSVRLRRVPRICVSLR